MSSYGLSLYTRKQYMFFLYILHITMWTLVPVYRLQLNHVLISYTTRLHVEFSIWIAFIVVKHNTFHWFIGLCSCLFWKQMNVPFNTCLCHSVEVHNAQDISNISCLPHYSVIANAQAMYWWIVHIPFILMQSGIEIEKPWWLALANLCIMSPNLIVWIIKCKHKVTKTTSSLVMLCQGMTSMGLRN